MGNQRVIWGGLPAGEGIGGALGAPHDENIGGALGGCPRWRDRAVVRGLPPGEGAMDMGVKALKECAV